MIGVATGLGLGALVWGLYKMRQHRPRDRPMDVLAAAWNDPTGVADMGRFEPGAAAIACQPWDIGTGVVGYVWHAPKARAALLLQHGYAEYAQRFVGQYNNLIPHLLHAGISVYAFDLWGHGHSPGPRAVTDVRRAVRDHLAARQKLREQRLPVFLLGHSLGGLVTASSVARDQRGVRGVVLSSAALVHAASPLTLMVGDVAAFVAPTAPAPRAAAAFSRLYRGAEQVDVIARDPLMHRGQMPVLLAATGGRLIDSNWNLYPSWRVPTLLMHGTADRWTDPQGSRRLFAAIASQDKTLHLVDGGYHELLNDTDRDDSLRVLLKWLEQRL